MKMKKLMFTLLSTIAVVVLMIGNVQAQKKYVNKALLWAEKGEYLDSALKLVIASESDEKTKDWAKTYYTKGKIYKAMHKTGEEKYADAIVNAIDNFILAYDKDGAAGIKTLIDGELIMLPNEVINTAVAAYENDEFSKAFIYFEKTVQLKSLDLFGNEIDTTTMYNAALMAQRAKDYDNAIKYYKKTSDLNFGGGDVYALLGQCYKQSGDTASYLNALQQGYTKYPDNQTILGTLINYYLLEAKDSKEGIKYLDKAIEQNPTNAQLYIGKAMFYDQDKDVEKAIEMYKKAIEMDPNSFDAQYNIGVLYFNQGVELTNTANEIKDNEKYMKAKKIADDKFKEALPFLEKAYEIKPEEPGIGNTLRTLYYRLQMNEKYEKISQELGY